jgi:hypothetical protein
LAAAAADSAGDSFEKLLRKCHVKTSSSPGVDGVEFHS